MSSIVVSSYKQAKDSLRISELRQALGAQLRPSWGSCPILLGAPA